MIFFPGNLFINKNPFYINMKKLVVFYSRTGNTRKVAESIAISLGGDIAEVFDKKPREGLAGFLFAGKDAVKKSLTDILEPDRNPGEYSLIVLGTPVWGGSITPAIRTYLTKNCPKLKQVAFFTCSSSEIKETVFLEMSDLAGKKPIATLSIKARELKDNSYGKKVSGFVKNLS